MKIEGAEKASTEDSKKVVAICTRYAQSGMLTIFISLFFAALAFAFLDPFSSSAISFPLPCSGSTRPSSWPTPGSLGQRQKNRRSRIA